MKIEIKKQKYKKNIDYVTSDGRETSSMRRHDINDEKWICRVQDEPFEPTLWDKRFARMRGRNVQKEQLERILGTNTWNKRQVVFTKIIGHHASILFYNRAPSVLPIIEYLVPLYRCIEHLEEARSSLVLSNSLP